jgi:ATP-binding cassette subfamily C protein
MAIAPLGSVVAGIALVSGVINILALTSPLFMLQVYDRVLLSRSVPTLIGLAGLAIGLYAFQAMLDVLRSRILLRIGERFDHRLSGRVHAAVLRLPLEAPAQFDGTQPLRDLDNVRGFLSGQGPTVIFDLPWMPLYLGICFLFHVWIGVTALAGAIILVSLTLVTDILSRRPARDVIRHGMVRNATLEAARRNAEAVCAMGLERRLASRWREANESYLAANRRAADVASAFGGTSRSLRLVLQSTILGVGAYLVINQEASAGVMIASSIMMGRALAPVDLAIASWKPFLMARQSWARLNGLLAQVGRSSGDTMVLPAPGKELRVETLSMVPPGERKPTAAGISFTVPAGSALGVIGPSGSGKSTLARALVGVWKPAGGAVRLDGASLDQWQNEALGCHIGYLPQGVELFDGTIADNIARFDPAADSAAVVGAAVAADAHDLILHFEKGYETRVGESGSALSAGQRQRIGLARALYRDPFLVVLDEPNANLDAEGEAAVLKAVEGVRRRKGIAVVIAHRPSALGAVDLVLAMDSGRVRAFGRRDEVLSQILKKPGQSQVSGADQGFPISARSVSGLRVVAAPARSPVMDDVRSGEDGNAGHSG